MNCKILNREFRHPSDGFYQVEAKGFHPLSDGRKIVQVVDDQAIASIANRFNADVAESAFHHGEEMLIDREHFKYDEGKDTVAYGWGRQAQGRGDGIYCRIDWTGTGRPAVDKGDYRFFSTEYDPEQTEVVPDSEIPAAVRNKFPGWKFLRPLRLDGLTLTNMHNNAGQRPITNRNTLPGDPANSPAGEQADIQNRKKTTMKLIAQKLGLSAEASEDAILGELSKLENRLKKSEEDLRPVSQERDTLKNRVTELLEIQAEADLDLHGIKDEQERKDLKAVLISNRATGLIVLKRIFKASTPDKKPATPVHNRQGAKTPTTDLTDEESQAATAKAEARAARISNRARKLREESSSLSLPASYQQAEAELAEEESAAK